MLHESIAGYLVNEMNFFYGSLNVDRLAATHAEHFHRHQSSQLMLSRIWHDDANCMC